MLPMNKTKAFCATAFLLASAYSHAALNTMIFDFEDMAVAAGPDDNGEYTVNTDLSDAGWQVTGNVYDGSSPFPGNYIYFYGAWYDAPNTGAGGFSAIAADDDTIDGGSNYLNIYSDYDNRGAQDNGQIVNAIFAQNIIITADDIGKSVTFSFDAKRPDIEDDGFGGDDSAAAGNGCANECVAQAFLKTQDPANNWSTTNELIEVTTAISQDNWGSYTLTLDLTDPLLEGQNLQFGFESFATNDDNTGVYYDNVSLIVTAEEEEANVPFPQTGLVVFGSLLLALGAYRKKINQIK